MGAIIPYFPDLQKMGTRQLLYSPDCQVSKKVHIRGNLKELEGARKPEGYPGDLYGTNYCSWHFNPV